MKIAFLLGNIDGAGGIAKATSIVSNYLANSLFYDVHIISYFSLSSRESSNERIHYVSVFKKQVNMKSGLLIANQKISHYLKENEIDVLVSCGALYFILGAISTKMLKTKSIAWEHSNYTSNYGHIGKKYTRRIGAIISDYVVTLTEKDKYNYLKYVKKSNVEFIYNPIDPLILMNKANYNASSKNIITVGNINPFKNYEELILVAQKVFEKLEYANWKWDIYGEGPLRGKIEKQIEDYGLVGKVNLKGKSDCIYNILNDYSIYVCTSKSEGLPMALIEAKAKKLPIVSFDIMTGPSEIINDGVNGYLAELHNIDEMAEKIRELMESVEKREIFSSNAYINIEKFRLEACAEKWDLIIKKLLKKR